MESRKHFVGKQLEAALGHGVLERQSKLEVVNALFDEGMHLLDDLLRGANERLFTGDVVSVESSQFGLVFGAKTASEPGTSQGRRIAPHLVTGTLTFGDQLAIRFDARPTDVPPICIASNEAEHAWSRASDDDGRKWIGLWFTVCLGNLVMFTENGRLLFSPESFDDLNGLLQFRDPCASRGKVVAVSAIFVFFPACPNAENKAPFSEILQRGCHLRQQRRMAEGLAKDNMADVELRLQSRPVGESRPSLQQGLVVHLQVINEPQGVDLIGTPLLAGLVGTLRSGHLGTGTLSGLWSGFLVGLCLAIYIIILYLTNAPTQVSPESARQAQNVLAQQGIQISMQSIQANAMRQVGLTGLVIADVILVLLWLGIGAVLGVIGGAIGKIFVRQPRDYVVPAAAAAPHYDETPPQEQYVEPSPNYTAPPVEEPPTEPTPQEEARATEDSYNSTPSARSSLDEVPPQES